MNKFKRLLKLHKLLDAAGDGGSDTGGTGTGEGQGQGTQDKITKDGGDAGEGGDKGKGKGKGKGDDKPKMSDEAAELLKDVMKHKGRANQLEGQVNELKSALEKFEGIDPAQVRALLTKVADEERSAAEKRGEYDRIVAQMKEAHEADIKRVADSVSEKDATINGLAKQVNELTVGNAFATSHFVSEELTLTPNKARVIFGSHFEYKDGNVVGYDKPAGAPDRTVLVGASGAPLPFEQALQKLVDADPERDQLYRSKAKDGSGSGTASVTNGTRKAIEENNKSNMSSQDKIESGLAQLLAPKK